MSTTPAVPQYVPGQVVNGYMLTEQNQWVPVQPAPAPAPVPVQQVNTSRVIAVKPINHLKHGALTLLTGGFWGIVWAGLIIYRKFER